MEIVEQGDLFTSSAQTLVNTVNCMGVMGKGLALRFKNRYPRMFQEYAEHCKNGLLDIGKLWLYTREKKWVLNFPTKYDWRAPSEIYFLEAGLEKFILSYKDKHITSIAFPLLGSSNGGIDPDVSLALMQRYLCHCEIPVTIYLKYQPRDAYPLFNSNV